MQYQKDSQSRRNLSLAKADKFAAGNENSETRTKAKQAILQELNSHLKIKAEKLHLKARDQREPIGDDGENIPTPSDEKSVAVASLPAPEIKVRPSNMSRTVTIKNPSPGSRIPMSVSRQRRRDATAKAHAYDPTYTWNRGGRVKELRIRCIARKYLHIWTRNAFGRVLPSVAKVHHEKAIVREAFAEWYDLWWTIRKEWRLLIRAQCHDRYRVWTTVWRAWKQFVIIQKVKKAKLALADNHFNGKLMQQVMAGWKEYTEVRRMKQALKQKAEEVADRNLLRQYWENWKQSSAFVQQVQDSELNALQIWANTLKAKAWLRWKNRYQTRQLEKMKAEVATEHYHTHLEVRCMNGWIEYLRMRRWKKKQTVTAHQFHATNVTHNFFKIWKQRFLMKLAIKDHESKIEELAARFTARRMLEHWKHYIKLREDKRQAEEMAELHYRGHILTACFSGLRLAVVQGKLKIMRNKMAEDHYTQKTLRQTWDHWMLRCEDNEELKMLSETRVARCHHGNQLQKKMLRRWIDYMYWRRERNAQYAKADGFFMYKTLPKYLDRIRLFVDIEKNKREMAAEAKEFRKQNALSRFFYSWHTALEESQENRMAERMAIIHYDDNVAKRFFKFWKKRTREALLDHEKDDTALDHFSTQICVKVFNAWKQYVKDKKDSRVHERVALCHNYKTGLRKHWNSWRGYTLRRREKRLKLELARCHHKRKVLQLCLGGWLQYHRLWTEVTYIVEDKEQQHNNELLRWAFHEWADNVTEQKEEQKNNQLADHHYSKKMAGKVFKSWQEYAGMHAYKKYQKIGEVENAREVLDEKKRQLFFSKWKMAKDEAVLQRLKYEQAICHHERLITRKMMMGWKGYTNLCLRKQLMQRQCQWFHNTTLTARVFLRWRSAHQQRLMENDKTFLALYQWSLNLQRKVIVNWYNYTVDKKRKKERVAMAMERRRRRLLTDGLRQWLTVSADMQEMRLKWAADRHAKSAYDILHVVKNCALHWRAVTLKRKEGRGGAPLVRKPTVVKPALSRQSPEQREEWKNHPQRVALEPSFHQAMRARPRRPDFLMESLKREGLYSPTRDGDKTGPSQVPVPRMDPADLEQMVAKEMVAKEKLVAKENQPPQPRTPLKQHVPGAKYGSPGSKYASPIRQEKVKITIPSLPIISREEQRSRSLPNTPIKTQGDQISQKKVLMTPEDFSPKKGRISFKDVCVASPVNLGGENGGTSSPAKQMRVNPSPLTIRDDDVSNCEKVELMPPSAFMVSRDDSKTASSKVGSPRFKAAPGLPRDADDGDGDGSSGDKEEELIEIRNTLQEFGNYKQRLGLLKTQYAQLSDWLQSQSLDEVNDDDSQHVVEELEQMTIEIRHLTTTIDEGRPLCQRLVRRANALISCLDG
ncbi:protein SFI1 homolog [Lineus longissimus]|uniref:protein SFI1 homolog n=1 Tax=Lineus longissimus TaxID=88925 RepID=UPI002B4D5EA3